MNNIKQLCAKHGLSPSKSKGQNFLIDKNIVKKIIANADLDEKDVVLEIGPGFGILTRELMLRANRVVAVELDKKIFEFLEIEFSGIKNLELINGDVLKLDLEELNINDRNFKIVANLPYGISAHFLKRFLCSKPKPKEIIVMLQKEVGERIMAKPGKMSLLSISVRFFADPKILFSVSRSCFWPEPKVDSAVLRIKLKNKIPFDDEKFFFRVVKVGFSSKRKQLQNNLSSGLYLKNAKIREILINLGLDEKIRAQDLSLEDWARLSEALIKKI